MSFEKTVTELVSRMGTIEGILNNGINKRLDMLLEYREKDRDSAIDNREKDRKLIMAAIETRVKTCPNSTAVSDLKKHIKTHMKNHENNNKNIKEWFMFWLPSLISIGMFVIVIYKLYKESGGP